MFRNLREHVKKITERLGQKMHIDAWYVARGGFWASLEFVFSSLLSLGLIFAFANLISKETFGTYKYIMSIAGSLGFLTLTGMNTAVMQSVARGNDGALPFAVGIQFKWNVLFSIGALFSSAYYAWQGNQTIALSLAILAITFPLSTALNSYGAFLAGKKNFRTGSLFGSLSSVFYTITLLGALFFSGNVIVLVAAYGLGNLIPMCYFYFHILRKYKPKPLESDEKEQILKYGKHLSLLNIFSTVSAYVDKIVIFHFLGAVELAVYSLALAMPERIRGYSKTITGILLPKLTERSIKEIRSVFYARILQASFVGIGAAVGYIVLSPFIFKYALPQYVDSIQFSQVISLSLIFTIPGAYIASVFRAHKMVRILYWSTTGTHSLRIVLVAILGAIWGIWGVIIATLIVNFLGTIYNMALWELELRKKHTYL